MMRPVVAEVAREYREIFSFVKLDVNTQREKKDEYGIRGTPTYIVFKDGEIVQSFLGAMPKDELVQRILEILGISDTEKTSSTEPARVAPTPAIDFAAEKAEIQAVYSAFYKAFNDNDIKGIQETFDSTIVFGTVFPGNEPVPLAIGWRRVTTEIQGLWIGLGTKGAKWGRDDKLTDFWIRGREAAAIGYNCFKGRFPGETHLYFVKDEEDGWKIHELDSINEGNLKVFGFHKGKPRIKQFIKITQYAEKVQ